MSDTFEIPPEVVKLIKLLGLRGRVTYTRATDMLKPGELQILQVLCDARDVANKARQLVRKKGSRDHSCMTTKELGTIVLLSQTQIREYLRPDSTLRKRGFVIHTKGHGYRATP